MWRPFAVTHEKIWAIWFGLIDPDSTLTTIPLFISNALQGECRMALNTDHLLICSGSTFWHNTALSVAPAILNRYPLFIGRNMSPAWGCLNNLCPSKIRLCPQRGNMEKHMERASIPSECVLFPLFLKEVLDYNELTVEYEVKAVWIYPGLAFICLC